MSGVARTFGSVAGVIATVAAFIPGGQGIAAIAGAVAAVSNVVAAATQKKPRAKGQVNERILARNHPAPCILGRTYSGGVERYAAGYGGTVSGVANPYQFIAAVYSVGPVDGLESVHYNYETIPFSGTAATGYYAGFAYRDFQLGALPESDALTPNWSGAPSWGAASKLSGRAAIGHSLKFDKKAKRFGGGLPAIGAIWRGVKLYDPRLDSTFAGGSGSCRANDQTTWVYSQNPALHAGSYALARVQNGKKVFGLGFAPADVIWASVAAWANVCDTNGWTVGGSIYEPGDKWNNLKLICEAGGGEPILANGTLDFIWSAPRVALDEISAADVIDGDNSAQSNVPWAERINTRVPKYRSEAHQWNYVAADAVAISAFVTEDGEPKSEERQWDLVQNKDQVTELAAYDVYDLREAGPFTVTLGPRFRHFRPGDALTLLADAGFWPTDLLTIIRSRRIDPLTGSVTFELAGETASKHAACLGLTGAAPPATTVPTGEERDGVIGGNVVLDGFDQTLITQSFIAGGVVPVAASDAGSAAEITIIAHDRVYGDKVVSLATATITGLDFSTPYWIYYDDPDRAGGAVTYYALDGTVDPITDSFNSANFPHRHSLGLITTPADGGGPTTGGVVSPPGYVDALYLA